MENLTSMVGAILGGLACLIVALVVGALVDWWRVQ